MMAKCMANVQMDYKDFPLKQRGFSLKLRADSAPVIGPMSALGVKLGSVAATGIVALSFECLGAALVLFGIAGWMLS